MTVYQKKSLLHHHAFSRLRLIHAAFVDSYECHSRNRMPVNRLLFVIGGGTSAIRDTADGRLLPMKAGHVYFIPCNHVIDLDIAANLHFLSLQFNLELFYGFDIMESCSRCEMIEAPALIAELRELLERESELRTLCRINEIIFHLCAKWGPGEGADIQQRLVSSRKYQKILEFVREHGDATTTVEMLADMHGKRKDVFSRNFKKDMGISPKEFISAVLTRKASEMLLSPNMAVKDVAEALNFSSEYYFSHFFKKHTGTSPRAHQKQHTGS